jgi:hypothetical protein
MSANVNTFDMAALSEASYVLLDQASSLSDEDVKTALQNSAWKGVFSETQAAEFVSTWRVVHHQLDTDSCFSATLFERKDSGRFMLGCRGTAQVVDDFIINDGSDIVIDSPVVVQMVERRNRP